MNVPRKKFTGGNGGTPPLAEVVNLNTDSASAATFSLRSLRSLLFKQIPSGVLLFPLALLATDNVTVSSTTYTGTSSVQADNSITTSSSVVVNNGADVTFQAGAKATLATGFKVNSGGLFHLAIGQMLPYAPSFESTEGFSLGSIAAQRGWILTQGTVSISNADAYMGSYSVAVSATTPAGSTRQVFQASSSPSITFVEFFAKPVAASSVANSSIIATESAQIAFQISSSQGAVYVYDGVGANQWVDTGVRFAINGSNQATSWLRFTLREDYTNHKWDLYVGGVLADYDLAFLSNSESYFRSLSLGGTTTATAYYDGVLAQTTNPLFTDSDKDGMPDSYETANGLNNSSDDRNSDHDSDGRSNIEEYFLGTLSNNADVTAPSTPASLVLVHSAPTALGISWNASTDTGSGTPGVAGYNVYRGGVKVNSSLVTTTYFTETGLSASTSYSYTVKAVDLAGNLSSASSGFSATTPASSGSGSFEVFTPVP